MDSTKLIKFKRVLNNQGHTLSHKEYNLLKTEVNLIVYGYENRARNQREI